MHISTQLIERYPRKYGCWSCSKEKLSIPLEAHYKPQSSDTFLSFQAKKNEKSCNFFLFWWFMLKLHIKASEIQSFRPTYDLPKCGQEKLRFTPFWGWPRRGDRLSAGIIESHNFFVLRPILVKFHFRTRLRKSFLMIYRFWKCSQEKLHFTPVHTLRQLKRDEALFPPLWRVVEFRARYG